MVHDDTKTKSHVKINCDNINAVCSVLSAKHCPKKENPHSSSIIFWIFSYEKARTIYPTHPWIHEGKIHTNQKANSKRHKKGEIEKNNCLVGWQVNFKVESKSQRKK